MTTPLVTCGKPYFFRLSNPRDVAIRPPEPRRGVAVRLWARSLSEMQKEALVASTEGQGTVWRLSSDEGPYLNGSDVAPCPLSFFTTGMVSSFMEEIRSLADQRGIVLRDLILVQDNFYTMEGSASRGTMRGGALPVELEAKVASDASDSELFELMGDAVGASPINGLMRREHRSLFTLTHNGQEIRVGAVGAREGAAHAEPAGSFEDAQPLHRPSDEAPIVKLVEADEAHAQKDLVSNRSSSLQEYQKRTLHVRGTCRVRSDGIKEIRQELLKPYGSTFRYLSEESRSRGGQGRAPDAASYVSAGIGFCFMTQLGRYARIALKDLKAYRIVQDTHFTRGGASGGTGEPGDADAVETHVYLETDEDDAAARTILDMGEQTCFLHALCRTALRAKLKLSRSS